MNNFTVQIVQLKIDKEELEQRTFQTELRTDLTEEKVGFRRFYD